MCSKIIKPFIVALISLANTAIAAESSPGSSVNPRLATNEVENQIALDREANPLYESRLLSPLQDWRNGVADKTGFNWSLDYTGVLMEMDGSAGEDNAGSGIVRFFGFWDLVDRGGPNKGSLNWKIENRHSYTDVAVNDLGFESGYVGLFEAPFSNQQTRLTNLYWKQYFADGNATAVAGFLDPTDYLDIYLMASPWMGFNNFVFSTGSAAMDLPNDATLGAALGGMVSEKVYVHAGIADANSDPTDPFKGFDTFVNESDYFSWLEIGHIPGLDQIYFDNTHLTLWHIDERANGSPGGWGLNASWQRWIDDKWLPFVRGGYTEDSGSLLEKSLTAGFGYQPVPLRGVIGLGFNWGKPNPVSFADTDAQYTTELFWRYQLTKELAITPSIQYINNPALNAQEEDLWAFGFRMRIAI